MISILKAVQVYSPKNVGIKDIFIANGYIEEISKTSHKFNFPDNAVKNLKGKIAIPGFIDGHIHIIGGGGEGGFTSRIPEIQTSHLLDCGITSVIGLLGTDSITKSLVSLFAKIKSLREEGINAYMMTGSYQYPVRTITGSIEKDIILIDPIIGVGELAISDHRSSAITIDEIKKISQECRVASLLSSKSGKVIVHVGSSKKMLFPLIEAVSDDEIEVESFLPTHVNRNKKLLENALEWMKIGGFVDLTAGISSDESLSIKDAVKYLLENGGDIDHILVSSDAQGSVPSFDEKGNFLSMKISDCSVIFDSFTECLQSGMNFEDALKPFTVNVANFFKLKNVGSLERAMRADVALLDSKTFKIDSIVINGEFRNVSNVSNIKKGMR